MTLATRLKKARLQSKKTQQQVAEEVGIKQQAVQRIEAGKVASTSYIVHIAKALKVSSDWLAFGPGDEPVPAGVHEHASEYSNEFPSVPLFAWNEVNQALNPDLQTSQRKKVPCFSSVSNKAFAIQLQLHDDSMVSPDGKVSFQRNDVIIIDPIKTPKEGSFVLATTPTLVLRKYVAEISNGAYLAALNPKYESIPYKQVKIFGVVVERISVFN